MIKKIGFGIIGTGSIAHIHATAIKSIEETDLIGAFNIHYEKAKIFCDRFGCITYRSIEDMLNNPKIDIVCICTPSGIHLEPALLAIAAGKHCLIEKPLEISTERCTEIIEAADKKGVRIGTIYPSRFLESNIELKRAVEQERFGKIAMADICVKWFRTEEYYASGYWRGTWKYDGGGALMNQGIHSIDLLQWIMGPVDCVGAIATNSVHKKIDAEDTLSAVIRFKNGSLGNIACSTAIYPGFPKRIEISGSKGSAAVEENNISRWEFMNEEPNDERIRKKLKYLLESTGGASRPEDISFYGHKRQIEDMILSIKLNRQPFIDGNEGRKSVAIVEAIYQSVKQNKFVSINSTDK